MQSGLLQPGMVETQNVLVQVDLRPKPKKPEELEECDELEAAVVRFIADATSAGLRKAYHHAVLQAHPDKGSCAQDFLLVHDAWEMLSTPCVQEVLVPHGYAQRDPDCNSQGELFDCNREAIDQS